MPILEDDDMDDRVVYWAKLGEGFDGQPVYDEPTNEWVNWRVRRSASYTPDGTKVTIDVQLSLTFEPNEGDRFWRAPDQDAEADEALDQWYDSGSAGHADEVMRVMTVGRTQDAKAIEQRYTAGLVWDRDQGAGEA